MKPPRPKIISLAERLVASCQGDENYEVDELTLEECKELDFLVFECQGCNQWFRQHDNATRDEPEWLCRECARGG